jgi:hypothetical protein
MVQDGATSVRRTVAKKRLKRRVGRVRLSVTLTAAQRKAMQAIADRNHTSIAYVIRYALDGFIKGAKDKRLTLHLPEELE